MQAGAPRQAQSGASNQVCAVSFFSHVKQNVGGRVSKLNRTLLFYGSLVTLQRWPVNSPMCQAHVGI